MCCMLPPIPSSLQIRDALKSLTMAQIDALAAASGVPATTIYKIKRGETGNPGIETVRKFMPHVIAAGAAVSAAEA